MRETQTIRLCWSGVGEDGLDTVVGVEVGSGAVVVLGGAGACVTGEDLGAEAEVPAHGVIIVTTEESIRPRSPRPRMYNSG